VTPKAKGPRKPETLRQFINRAAKEVERWPDWMKGKPDLTPELRHSLKKGRRWPTK